MSSNWPLLQGRSVVVPGGFEVLDPCGRATLIAGLKLCKRVLNNGTELGQLRGREVRSRRLPWGECRGDGRTGFVLARRRCGVRLAGGLDEQGARGDGDDGVVAVHRLLAGQALCCRHRGCRRSPR